MKMLLPPSVYSKKIIVILFVLSLCFFLLACTCLIGLYPVIVKNGVYSNVQLIKDTEQFDRFKELPFPILFKVHFFNVTNSDDILKGRKPILREVGPYVYNEFRKKTIRSINEATDTITYTERQHFQFNQDESADLSDEDEITVANAAYTGLIQKAEDLGVDQILSTCLHDIMGDYNSPFITVKVKDLLFNGINYFQSKNNGNWIDYFLCSVISGPVRVEAERLRNNELQKDGSLKFSFFNYKNTSHDGVYTVKRGIQDITRLGEIVKYNAHSEINNWRSNSTCNQVKGTDSTIYPPTVTKSSVLTISTTDLCRTLDSFFVEETRFKNINVYQFQPNNTTFMNSNKKIEQDDCYCSQMTKDLDGKKSCFLDGVLDVQPCVGAPVIVSFPHFLYAEKYLKYVEGLKPDKNLHNSVLLIEPTTGIPLKGGKRIQLNVVMRPINSIKSLEHVSRSLLPILWIDEYVEVPDALVDEINEKLFNTLYYIRIFLWSFLGLTVGSSFVYVFVIIFL